MLRLHEAFRDGQRTLADKTGLELDWPVLGIIMKRWIAYEIPKEDGEILENEWFFFAVAVVERDFANQFRYQFEYEVNHFFCG